jgi:putative FmdB family regulatory protein
MPVYEFDCGMCGERIEVRASIAAGPGTVACPECGSEDVRRYWGSVMILGAHSTAAAARRSAPEGPEPGALRPADGGDLTRNVARQYAKGTGDLAVAEVARLAEAGAGPGELHDIVREAKSDRESRMSKGRVAT